MPSPSASPAPSPRICPLCFVLFRSSSPAEGVGQRGARFTVWWPPGRPSPGWRGGDLPFDVVGCGAPWRKGPSHGLHLGAGGSVPSHPFVSERKERARKLRESFTHLRFLGVGGELTVPPSSRNASRRGRTPQSAGQLGFPGTTGAERSAAGGSAAVTALSPWMDVRGLTCFQPQHPRPTCSTASGRMHIEAALPAPDPAAQWAGL